MTVQLENDGWWAWFYSTDEWTDCNASSEVSLNALPAEAYIDGGGGNYYISGAWLKLVVKGLNPNDEFYSGVAQKRTYKAEVLNFVYPDEFAVLTAVKTALRNRWKYLCIDGYNGSPITSNKYPEMLTSPVWRLHTSGKCIALHEDEIDYDTEDDDENGTKILTINCENRKIKV